MTRRPRRYAKVLTVPIYKGRMNKDLMKAFNEKYGNSRTYGDLQEWLIDRVAGLWAEEFGVNPFDYI